MAAIRKRGTKWQVQIRRQGFPTLSRTFLNKSDACEWARHWEVKADRYELPISAKILDTISLGQLVKRYRDEVASRKRGAELETMTLNVFLREPICRKKLSGVTTADFAAYRDKRVTEICTSTLARQLAPLSNMFNIAKKEWGLPLRANPLSDLRIDAQHNKRAGRLQVGELNRLVSAAGKTRNPLILPIVRFALETGMRRGEILNMEWGHIDLERRSLLIPEAKNGHSRTIPLTTRACALVQGLGRHESKIFPITANALRLSWSRITKRAKIDDLHFHDLRHEAISRFFELGLTVPEVASISGHRDVRMLMRYAHADSRKLARKLDAVPFE